MSTKEVLLELVEELPADATLQEAIVELEIRARVGNPSRDASIPSPTWHEAIVKERMADIAAGKEEFFTVEEAREILRKERG
jgi:hypothetical protein